MSENMTDTFHRKEMFESNEMSNKGEEASELFELINKNLNVFTLERDFYEKVLNIMIDKDYIKVDNDMVEKLLW